MSECYRNNLLEVAVADHVERVVESDDVTGGAAEQDADAPTHAVTAFHEEEARG